MAQRSKPEGLTGGSSPCLDKVNQIKCLEINCNCTYNCFIMNPVEFDWDDAKEEINIKKHRVDFLEAQTVFNDPLAVTLFDEDSSADEERFLLIGHSAKARTLLVVFAEKVENLIRIISARTLTAKERKDYEEGI